MHQCSNRSLTNVIRDCGSKSWYPFLQTVAEEWNVEAMPTFVFIKEGKEVDRVVGANKDGLIQTIGKHAADVIVTA